MPLQLLVCSSSHWQQGAAAAAAGAAVKVQQLSMGLLVERRPLALLQGLAAPAWELWSGSQCSALGLLLL